MHVVKDIRNIAYEHFISFVTILVDLKLNSTLDSKTTQQPDSDEKSVTSPKYLYNLTDNKLYLPKQFVFQTERWS